MKKLILLLLLLCPLNANAAFLYDTFTDTAATAIASHTPDVGSTWAQIEGTAGVVVINGAGTGIDTGTDTTRTSSFNAATPYNGSYYCEIDVKETHNNSTAITMAPAVRKQAGATTYYECTLDGTTSGSGTSSFRIASEKAGAFAALTAADFAWATGTVYNLRLYVYTNAAGKPVLTCVRDSGAARITVVDNNANPITGTGTGGFVDREATGTTSIMDNMKCDGYRPRRVM